MSHERRPYSIEFWKDDNGSQPVRNWVVNDLSPQKRRFIGFAMSEVLQEHGPDVCETEWGKWLDSNIFEFRARDVDQITLRVYCHAAGDRLILLLHAYDKGEQPSKQHETKQIETAKKRLTEWRLEQDRLEKVRQKADADARSRAAMGPVQARKKRR